MASDGSDLAPTIDAYAPIGDGRTVALIGPDGSVDWMPLPELTSAPIFARILDADTGGAVELRPDAPFEVRRRYLARTNVLETTFTTDAGVVKVTDALVTGLAGRLPWAELARRIEGVRGTVSLRWTVRPGTSLSSASPWLDRTRFGPVIRCGPIAIAVIGIGHGPATPDPDGPAGPVLTGRVRVAEGARHLLALSATSDEPLQIPDPAEVDERLDRTVESWRRWSRDFAYDGPWASAVQRSALILKQLIYSPTGAIVAAATTSLPEGEDGKNWDYRFAWVRDLAYTAHALVRFGLREETHAALSWMLQTIRRHGDEPHVMYTVHGDTVPDEVIHDVPGWRGIGPVVSGNRASTQLQLGVFGDLIAICRTYVDAENILDPDTAQLLTRVADRTCDLWRRRDSGMWELPELQHYTSSKMGCWKALDDAIALAEDGAIAGSVERWRAERERIRQWIDENCWSAQRGAYLWFAGSDRLDASVLLHAPTGFDRGERMSRTIDALTAELGTGPHLYRYSGAAREEKAFVACGFWRAHALACVGRHDEAVAAMDELVAAGGELGVYPEMVDPDTGEGWGNTPQALSHLSFINAALTLRDIVPAGMLDGR